MAIYKFTGVSSAAATFSSYISTAGMPTLLPFASSISSLLYVVPSGKIARVTCLKTERLHWFSAFGIGSQTASYYYWYAQHVFRGSTTIGKYSTNISSINQSNVGFPVGADINLGQIVSGVDLNSSSFGYAASCSSGFPFVGSMARTFVLQQPVSFVNELCEGQVYCGYINSVASGSAYVNNSNNFQPVTYTISAGDSIAFELSVSVSQYIGNSGCSMSLSTYAMISYAYDILVIEESAT